MDNFMGYDAVAINAAGDAVVVLDQRLLPGREVFLELRTAEEVYEAISHLKVRGAPAIGVAAAYGAYVATRGLECPLTEFVVRFKSVCSYLNSSRPTAVNLKAALDRMYGVLADGKFCTLPQAKEALRKEADAIKEEDVRMCEKIARNGLSLLKHGSRILTHCNAGHLAVSRFGTALGPVHLAQEKGLAPKVYADETRPLLQGARLTMYELVKHGVDATLVCDNMASYLMAHGMVDLVMVGCDRVAANGDVANKIGTSGVAILAREYGIPFYVLGPSTTIDVNCASGDDIVIEERPGSEITELLFREPVAPEGAKTFNPAFDVTKAKYITAIVTDEGIFRPPFNFKK